MSINWFYDDYEGSSDLATTIDSICMSCPVRKLCYKEGTENQEMGVWGGVFLTNGRDDPVRNAHKTEDIWKQIRSAN